MALSLVGVSASALGLGEGVTFVLTGVKKLLMDFCLLEDPDMNVAYQRLFVLPCQSANQYVQYETGSVKAFTKTMRNKILRAYYWMLENSNLELTLGLSQYPCGAKRIRFHRFVVNTCLSEIARRSSIDVKDTITERKQTGKYKCKYKCKCKRTKSQNKNNSKTK